MARLLDRVYPALPVWGQNLSISLYGIAYRHERLGGDFEKCVARFLARDRWTPAQMQAYVEEKLRAMLVHALDQVPYYRAKWTQAGLTRADLASMTLDDLPKLPVTPKQDVRAAPDAFLASSIARRQKLCRYYTSGSTGTPVTCVSTADVHRRFIAAREVRSFGWAGTSLRLSHSTIGGRMVVPRSQQRPPYYRYNPRESQVYFSAYHVAPQNVRHYLEGFHRYRPRVLTGYAYSHYLLARMMLEQGLTLDYMPDAMVLSSERLTSDMKRVIREAFRARPYEEYGAVENCVIATECEDGRMHVSPDFGILEIADMEGRSVSPGEEGRVLGTGLLNFVQPLIRYEIGDRAVWSGDKCSCGRHQLPVLREVIGRLEDVVVGPDGREMVRFHGLFVDLANVLEGQVVQEARDRFRVLVVTSDGFGDAQQRVIRERFMDRLGPVQVKIEQVSEIARTERGKFRAVISLANSHETSGPRLFPG